MNNNQSSSVMTLSEALGLAEYTLNDDGSLSCHLGDYELIPLWERNVRAEIQTLDMLLEFSRRSAQEHDDSETENLEHFKEEYNVVLDYMMSMPGHIPETELPEAEWKAEARAEYISNLDDALKHLDLKPSEGEYLYTDDAGTDYRVDKEYCLNELKVLENNRPKTDEGIYFWPFHNNRMLAESYRLVLKDLENTRR